MAFSGCIGAGRAGEQVVVDVVRNVFQRVLPGFVLSGAIQAQEIPARHSRTTSYGPFGLQDFEMPGVRTHEKPPGATAPGGLMPEVNFRP